MDFEGIQKLINERNAAEHRVYTEITLERTRQFTKWGDQNRTKYEWLAILTEEVGEVAKAILECDHENYQEELIQVAATVVTTLEDIRKQYGQVER